MRHTIPLPVLHRPLSFLVAVGLLLVPSCGGDAAPAPAPARAPSPEAEVTRPTATAGLDLGSVALLGDSIAVGEGLALAAALDAGGVDFHPMASEGGGNVVGPFSEENWETLAQRLDQVGPTTVIYQLTTFDWGTIEEQRDAYQRLADTVAGVGARLVLVTFPPIRPDEFYQPHLVELTGAVEAAREVALESDGTAVFLDAAEVWGSNFEETRDGVADRNPDGVHTCPQGAARFVVWLLDELARLQPEFAAPAPEAWADAGWSADDHFAAC